MNIARALQYVKQFEGLRLKPYRCPTGHWTIGYGHNLENGISLQAAEFLLEQDWSAASQTVQSRWPWSKELPAAARFVLTDMCFNMGAEKLAGFRRMLAALQRKDYATAAAEMAESRWAKQVGNRARILIQIMQKGEDITWNL